VLALFGCSPDAIEPEASVSSESAAQTAGGTDLSQLTVHEDMLAQTDGHGSWPLVTDVIDYDVQFANLDGQLPEDTEIFAPKGIATISTSDGREIQAIAGTLVFLLESYDADGLFGEESSAATTSRYAFSRMSYFTVSDHGSTLDITGIAGDQSRLITKNYGKLVFMKADGLQSAMSLDMASIARVDFDWQSPVEINDYVLVQKTSGKYIAVPQNVLFLNKLNVGPSGFGAWSIYFGLVLEGGQTVLFTDIKEAAICRKFTYQALESTGGFDCYSVLLVMKNGEAYKRDLYISYYGFGELTFISSLWMEDCSPGEWLTIQYIGALP